ncbi:MAG: DUF502 domain-containing protein [Maricaulaceae bacterium]
MAADDKQSRAPRRGVGLEAGSAYDRVWRGDLAEDAGMTGDPDLGGLEPPQRDQRLGRWVRNSFLTGVVVATPVGVTIWLIVAFVNFVDARVKPLIPTRWNPEAYLNIAIPGLGLVFAVMALTVLGAFAANFFGRTLIGMGERVLNGLPLVRTIYSGLKQVLETVLQQRERSFQEVALIQYPRPGIWALGFVTADAKDELKRQLTEEGDDFVGVFLPTTPNPTSGFLLYERRSKLKILDMSVEHGAKLIISAGLVYPNEADAVAEFNRLSKASRPDRGRKGKAAREAPPPEPIAGSGRG